MSASERRVAVVTGASSGIGLAAAKALAAQGWRIIAHGRDPARCAAAEAAIRSAAAPGAKVDMVRADLALMSEAARAADEISTLTSRIDVLLNNAGGPSLGQAITFEGNEATFAGNHLGHFLLTNRLLPQLRRAADGAPAGAVRIVNVSSSAHAYASGLDWNDLQMFEGFVPIRAYCNAKLANILFARSLARRLARSGVVAHAMHPGSVNSNFLSYADPDLLKMMLARPRITVEEGADTLIWLATAVEPGAASGLYYCERAATPTAAAAEDMAAAERLWRESEALVEASLNTANLRA